VCLWSVPARQLSMAPVLAIEKMVAGLSWLIQPPPKGWPVLSSLSTSAPALCSRVDPTVSRRGTCDRGLRLINNNRLVTVPTPRLSLTGYYLPRRFCYTPTPRGRRPGRARVEVWQDPIRSVSANVALARRTKLFVLYRHSRKSRII
jgi:hypothetical protein